MNRRNAILIPLAVLFGLFILTGIVAGFVTDYWWFLSLGLDSVFWTSYSAEYTLWFAGFVVFLLLANINFSIALRSQSTLTMDPRIQQLLEKFGGAVRIIVYGGSVFLAFIMAGMLSSFWMDMLMYLNAEAVGVADPVFGHDVGFYMFTLPFISALRGWLLASVVLITVATVVVYLIRQGVSFAFGRVAVSAGAQKHIAVLGAVFFILLAAGYWLDRFDILYSTRSGSFFGAGYTDVNAIIPAMWVMLGLSVVMAVLVWRLVFSRRYKALVKVIVGYIAVAIVAGAVYPGLIQKFIVNPNEQSKELPFIENNIHFTRLAYDLNRIEERSIEPQYNITQTDIRNDSATVRNIMLWDYRPLGSTLDQLQVIRLYYTFPDVDIDRYRLPDGSYRQVMLSARELDQSKLPANARTWVNTNLVYTHGYGLGMSPVNVVTEEGLPEFFVKDIPPVSEHGIEITRPEIYYGEKTDGHVIIRGNIEEFDYPEGDVNRMTTYEEESGVSIGSIFRRLLFAMHFGDLNILISGYIAPESNILYHRNIHDRVRRIAPFLEFDEDPYMVVADGRLYWIWDAYTHSDMYPYSKPLEDFNYIRNSVKVVIDAYTGETRFYEFDRDNDPVIRVLDGIFPELFQDQEELPVSLREHIRYPQDMFDYQSWVYSTYHMEDPQVFYNKEDLWNLANEKLQDHVVQMESYYAIMRLPGEPEEEFIQMVPYTPNKRDNMIAWLCARSDGDNYGKMLVYKFPKQELTYGPMQVSARIDQEPTISQQLTLWNQQGSSVTRGNLLVIPIKQDVLYVQPVYLQATSGKLPELKRVIVTYGNRIAMESSLDASLRVVFGGSASKDMTEEEQATEVQRQADSVEDMKSISQRALEQYNRSQKLLKEGRWSEYGDEIRELQRTLEKLVQNAE